MDPTSPSSMSWMNNYDVFLSIVGVEKGIHTFKDTEALELGDMRSELFHAIKGSRVTIVTFSENYARSKDELQKIIKREVARERQRRERLGINYVDYENGLKRLPKHSAVWSKKFLKKYGRR